MTSGSTHLRLRRRSPRRLLINVTLPPMLYKSHCLPFPSPFLLQPFVFRLLYFSLPSRRVSRRVMLE